MSTASTDVRWYQWLEKPVRTGTSAWLLRRDATRGLFGPDLDATAQDQGDIGPRRGDARDQFLHRRSTLRTLVARRLGVNAETVEIGYGRHGRPEILHPAGRCYCSVAARGDLAGYALADEPVGIDLESEAAGEIPWAVLTTSEAAALRAFASSDQFEHFLRLWTIKEAYLKARGSGLLEDPAAIDVAPDSRSLVHHGHHLLLPHSARLRTKVDSRLVIAACITLPSLHFT